MSSNSQQFNGASVNVPSGADSFDPGRTLDRAKALLASGDRDASSLEFQRLLSVPGWAPEGHYGIGVIQLSRGDLGAAESSLQAAFRLNPRHANAAFYLGTLAERRRDIAGAQARYEQALALAPGHKGALAKLAHVNPAVAATTLAPTSLGQPGLQRFGVFELLEQDPSALSRQTLALMKSIRLSVQPRITAYLGPFLRTVIGLTVAVVLLSFLWTWDGPSHATRRHRHHADAGLSVSDWAGISVGVALLVAVFVALVGLVVIRTTRITIDNGRLQLRRGIFTKRVRNIDLWRIREVELERTLLNRLTSDGTLLITTSTGASGKTKGRGFGNFIRAIGGQTTIGTADPDKPLRLVGIADGDRLEELYQELLNVVFLLRGNPIVKGIIQ